jgi:peptidoglycan-associated lipoprotein
MRFALLFLTGFAMLATGCSKQPAPTVAPTPSEAAPPPPPPAPPPASRPAPAGPTCSEIIMSTANALGEMIHFDTDRYDIRTGDAVILDRKAEIMRSHLAVRLRVTGHADERYTDEYNFVLGTRRAEAARDHLLRAGIDGSRVETASMGETQPLDQASNEDAWAMNRRDEFTLLAGRETLASLSTGCR